MLFKYSLAFPPISLRSKSEIIILGTVPRWEKNSSNCFGMSEDKF
jgi:hypothetical protein